MTGLPPTWCVSSVATISHPLRYGYTASADPEADGPRMLRITDIQDGHVQWSEVPRCEIAPDKKDDFLVSPGDIVFARTGGTVGKSFLIRKVPEPSVFASYLIKVAPVQGIEPRYLYWFFQSLSYWNQIASKKGGLQGNVNAMTLGSIELPLAPTNEQQRIVEGIEALFDEIDRGVQRLYDAKRAIGLYQQSLLKSAFEGRLTADWRSKNTDKMENPNAILARICKERERYYQVALNEWKEATAEWCDNGQIGKKPAKPKRPKSGQAVSIGRWALPPGWTAAPLRGVAFEAVLGKMLDQQKNRGQPRVYLGNMNLRWGSFNIDEGKKIPIEDHEVPRYGVKAGDLIVCEGGEPGRCAVWEGSDNSVFIQKALHRIRFTPSYSSRFAYFFFKFATVSGHLEKHYTGSTIKHLTGTAIAEVSLPICCPSEQAEVVRILDARLDAAEMLNADVEAGLAKAQGLRQSILKRAFSGHLVPQDPADEPAQALLARIRAGRGSDPTTKPRKHARRRASATPPP